MADIDILDGFDRAKTRALIFDCDGTLVDTHSLHYSSLELALKNLGLAEVGSQWYHERDGLSPAALFREYETHFGKLPLSDAELSRLITTEFQQSLPTLREVSLVAEVARRFHGELPMAVCSNGERRNVTASLKITGLLGLFDHVVTIEDVKVGKPQPEIYLKAAALLGVPAESCFVFEDSNEGLTAATRAGMSSIDVRRFILGRSV